MSTMTCLPGLRRASGARSPREICMLALWAVSANHKCPKSLDKSPKSSKSSRTHVLRCPTSPPCALKQLQVRCRVRKSPRPFQIATAIAQHTSNASCIIADDFACSLLPSVAVTVLRAHGQRDTLRAILLLDLHLIQLFDVLGNVREGPVRFRLLLGTRKAADRCKPASPAARPRRPEARCCTA